jgi:hypothetical protein
MTSNQQKLIHACIMLEQAKLNCNEHSVFMANFDAFLTNARSVTWIMQTELGSITGFEGWYKRKQEEMNKDPDFAFFNSLRVETTHKRTFNTPSRYTTSFPQGLTISGGSVVNIPFGKVDERSNLVIDNKTPITINGKPVTNIEHSTTSNYFFEKRPNEDAIGLCEAYLQKLQQKVIECHDKFKLS